MRILNKSKESHTEKVVGGLDQEQSQKDVLVKTTIYRIGHKVESKDKVVMVCEVTEGDSRVLAWKDNLVKTNFGVTNEKLYGG